MELQDLVVPYLGIALERQLYLASLLSENPYAFFDMTTGKVTIDDKFSVDVQILGTESYTDQSWLWGWANDVSNIPDNLLLRAKQLKQYGEQRQINALVQPGLTLDETHNGHYIGMLGSGLLNTNAYYSIGYDGGALYVLIDDENFPTDERDPLQRIGLTFPQLIGGMPVPDHRLAFKGYAEAHHLPILSETATQIQLLGSNNQTLIAQFDTLNRLTQLNAQLQQ